MLSCLVIFNSYISLGILYYLSCLVGRIIYIEYSIWICQFSIFMLLFSTKTLSTKFVIAFKSLVCTLFTVYCQAWFTLGWKPAGWTRSWVNLWNNLGFSLYAAPSVRCMVITSDDGEKSEMEVSADWCATVEHQRSSSIRVYLHRLSD